MAYFGNSQMSAIRVVYLFSMSDMLADSNDIANAFARWSVIVAKIIIVVSAQIKFSSKVGSTQS